MKPFQSFTRPIEEGTKSAFSGVFAFCAGMASSTLTATLLSFHETEDIFSSLFTWPLLYLYTLQYFWGFPLIIFSAIMFFGLVWLDWNRFFGYGALSLAATGTWLLCKMQNPFSSFADSLVFVISISIAAGSLWVAKYT
jgi:hypothetical protein